MSNGSAHGCLCEAGLVFLNTIAVDGTKIAAAASKRRIYDQARLDRQLAGVERILQEAEEVDRAEDELYGSANGNELPEDLRDAKARKARLEQIAERLLHHTVPSVPPMAAEILGKIGDRRAVESLMDVLRTSREPGLLEAAAEALGRLGDERAVSALSSFLHEGPLAARLRAVAALGNMGGDEAVGVMEDVAANAPSQQVRGEAQGILRDRRQVMTDKASLDVHEPHKHGIAVTLAILDETLCEVEQWANGREVQAVFYKERNALSEDQRQEILSEIARMRGTLQELQETLGVEPTVQDAASAIRGKCAGLWEHIVELKGKYLRRYGDVPADLEEYIDPRAEQLVEGILHILDTLKLQAHEKPMRRLHREQDSHE